MSEQDVDCSRRRFLIAATTTVGTVGAGFAAVPFVRSMMPNAATLAEGSVEVDLSGIEPGAQLMLLWRGRPVAVVRRTPPILASLKEVSDKLLDPDSKESIQPEYARNEWRSRKPEWLVMVAVCTHLGCIPLFKPTPGEVSANWKGGYFCPCHGSSYDLAGRVFKGVPAPRNMDIPPYAFLADGNKIVIGKDQA